MLKSLIKWYKKEAHQYGLVKRVPKPAEAFPPACDEDLPCCDSLRSIQASLASNHSMACPQLFGRESLDFFRPCGKGDLLACRYELKYRITESKARAVREYIQQHLPRDRYARTRPDGQYLISSLYLDSPDLKLCQETLLGKANRFKLRIRAYDDDPQSPVFFEIKRRTNKVIQKSRARIARSELQAVLEGPLDRNGRSPADQEALEQFLYYRQSIQARPMVLIRYLREPYEGDRDNRVRVTFDRSLCYRQVSGPEVTLNGHGWQRIELPFVILEIKFTDHYPAWLQEMVCAFNLTISSMSKYAASVKQWNRDAFSYYLE